MIINFKLIFILILNINYASCELAVFDNEWQQILEEENKFQKNYKELKDLLEKYKSFNKINFKIINDILLEKIYKSTDKFINILYKDSTIVNDYCIAQNFFKIFDKYITNTSINYIKEKLSILLTDITKNNNLYIYIIEEFKKKTEIEQLYIINNLCEINPNNPLVKKLLIIYKKLHRS
jgi:hypothetical protein